MFFSQTLYTHSAPFHSGPGLKLGEENPGLVLNMISDLKALKKIQCIYFVYNLMITCSEKKQRKLSEEGF